MLDKKSKAMRKWVDALPLAVKKVGLDEFKEMYPKGTDMQDIDKAMMARRGSEWLSSAARLQIQAAQSNTKYEAMMQDRIKELAREAGFNLDPDTGLILDTAGIYSVDDAARALATAVAEECAKIADDKASEIRLYCNEAHVVAVANAIRARFGLASPPGDDIKQD